MNLNLLFATAGTATDATQALGIESILGMVIPLAVFVAFFYFFLIRPEQKRNKEMQAMLNNIQVADEVITNGGIIGRVVSVKEDTVLIETGSDRTKIRIVKSAIAKNNTVHEMAEAEAAAKKSKKNGKTEIK